MECNKIVVLWPISINRSKRIKSTFQQISKAFDALTSFQKNIQIWAELLPLLANSFQNCQMHNKFQYRRKVGMSVLQDYFQLKNQWRAIGSWQGVKEYRHIYSRQQIEQHSFQTVDIKQLDIFTSRENYSFPFCPKIYKCSILHSYCSNNNLHFDIALIAEKLNYKSQGNFSKKMEQQLEHIVLGYQYLFKRYGPFLVTNKMIGWNQYNVAKVWFNQHFISNQIAMPASGEEQMVTNLLLVLEDMFQFKFISKNITNFNTLIDLIEKNCYKRSVEAEKKVKFDAIQNPRYSSSNKSSQSLFPRKLNKITFVYSNKTIHSKGNEVQSLASVEQLKQQRSNFIQFDKRSKRSKSSNQSINRKTEQFKSKMQLIQPPKLHYQSDQCNHQIPSLQDAQNMGQLQALNQPMPEEQMQKQNIQLPKRKSNKHLTYNFNDDPITLIRHHSRRYSNSLLQQQLNILDPLSKTQEKFNLRRKQSLLREELQQCLDGLFGSEKQVLQFDEKQLEKELDGVL